MKTVLCGLVMLLAIGMIAVAADMAPPGQDSPLAIVAGFPTSVVAQEVATVETEVPAEIARGGPERLVWAARVMVPVNTSGYGRTKRWRAWNAASRAI